MMKWFEGNWAIFIPMVISLLALILPHMRWYKQKLTEANMAHKLYTTKVRFDLEIEIYRELSVTFFSMVFDNGALFPKYLEEAKTDKDEEKQRKDNNYNKAHESYLKANNTLMKNAPFIPQDIFELFQKIRDDCCIQLNQFPYYGSNSLPRDTLHEEAIDRYQVRKECLNRTSSISENWHSLLEILRNHIARLGIRGEEWEIFALHGKHHSHTRSKTNNGKKRKDCS